MAAANPNEKLARMLHPLERIVLPFAKDCKSFSEIVVKSGLKDVEVMRAIEWLENKNLISTEKKIEKMVLLGRNGESYKSSGLPEQRATMALSEKPLSLSNLAKKAKLSAEEVSAAMGHLRKSQSVTFSKDGNETILTLTPRGRANSNLQSSESKFLNKKFPCRYSSLSEEETNTANSLLSRKEIVELKEDKEWAVTLTQQGKKLLS